MTDKPSEIGANLLILNAVGGLIDKSFQQLALLILWLLLTRGTLEYWFDQFTNQTELLNF